MSSVWRDPYTEKTVQDGHQDLIEKLMQLEGSGDKFEDVTDKELKFAGDLYVYLNMCPDNIKNTMMRIELEQLFLSGNV